MSDHQTLFDRIFEDEKKAKPGFFDSVREYMDVSDPSHPWNKIEKTLHRWSGKGGDEENTPERSEKDDTHSSSSDTKPKKVKLPSLKKPTADPSKVGSGIEALRRLKDRTKAVARERWKPAEGSAARPRIAGQAGYSAPPRNVTGPITSRNVGRRKPNPPTTR